MDEDKARQIVEAKNLAERQPEINLQISKAYLAATDESFVNRTWREVMTEQDNPQRKTVFTLLDKVREQILGLCISGVSW
jgi:hypothetical protein